MKDEMATPASPSDEALVRYLIGGLSQEESERLDELSIVDAEFSARLRAIEHDLADAYVRGELSADDRVRWERQHLASKHGREDLRLAQALLARERRQSIPRSRTTSTWGLAAAAVLVAATAVSYFAIVHRSSPVPATASIAPAGPASGPERPAPRIVALTLAPLTRSLAQAPSLQVPAHTDQVRLTLRLEPNDAERYDVAIKDLSSNAIVWRAAGLSAEETGEPRSLLVTIPAAALQSHRYLISVSGAQPRSPEIGTYLLQIVLQ